MTVEDIRDCTVEGTSRQAQIAVPDARTGRYLTYNLSLFTNRADMPINYEFVDAGFVNDEMLDGSRRIGAEGVWLEVNLDWGYMEANDYELLCALIAWRSANPFVYARLIPHADKPDIYYNVAIGNFSKSVPGRYVGYTGKIKLYGVDLLPSATLERSDYSTYYMGEDIDYDYDGAPDVRHFASSGCPHEFRSEAIGSQPSVWDLTAAVVGYSTVGGYNQGLSIPAGESVRLRSAVTGGATAPADVLVQASLMLKSGTKGGLYARLNAAKTTGYYLRLDLTAGGLVIGYISGGTPSDKLTIPITGLALNTWYSLKLTITGALLRAYFAVGLLRDFALTPLGGFKFVGYLSDDTIDDPGYVGAFAGSGSVALISDFTAEDSSGAPLDYSSDDDLGYFCDSSGGVITP